MKLTEKIYFNFEIKLTCKFFIKFRLSFLEIFHCMKNYFKMKLVLYEDMMVFMAFEKIEIWL